MSDDARSAAKTFGKFQDEFLYELFSEIRTHLKEVETGVSSQPVPGIIVHDSDVLQPEPQRPGGLQAGLQVCCIPTSNYSVLSWLQRHTFKRPAKPLEPPTPRTSILGLDRLAMEKRASAALERDSNKRPRLDEGAHFKGEQGSLSSAHHSRSLQSQTYL